MPLYEYECQSCGRRTELIQRVADAPLAECPECGGPVRRLLSAPAVQFKGTGWYVTDYAGRKGGSESAGEKTEGTSEAKGGKESGASSGASDSSKSK